MEIHNIPSAYLSLALMLVLFIIKMFKFSFGTSSSNTRLDHIRSVYDLGVKPTAETKVKIEEIY
jgi:uncharacterized protein YcbX